MTDEVALLARLLLPHPDQRVPTLLFAAVHDVLLAGDGHPLAAWYGSITDPARPVGQGDDDPWPHFRWLALEDDDVAERLRTRSTQTNEVGRCAALLPALAGVAASAPGAPPDGARPLGLVEIGASAGLNLLFDRYGYHYEPGGQEVNPSSPLTLRCTLRTAIALAHGDPARVVTGDAVDDLAPLVQAVGDFALPVVVATWILTYLPVDRQRALMAELDRLGAERDLTMVFAEQPPLVPGLAVPPRPDGRPDGLATALVGLDWREGRRTAVRLADLHPHGTWLEWLAD